MTVGVTSPVAETDPVRTALNDTSVQARLLDAARAFLAGRIFNIPTPRRGPEAEEIVQKAGLRIWEHHAEYDPRRAVVPWLIAFVENITREHVKKYARVSVGLPGAFPELDDLAADLGRPISDAIADTAFVERLLERLPPTDREVIRLAYYEDLTFAEIGVRVGLTENAARVRHHRILARLRELAGGTGEVQS